MSIWLRRIDQGASSRGAMESLAQKVFRLEDMGYFKDLPKVAEGGAHEACYFDHERAELQVCFVIQRGDLRKKMPSCNNFCCMRRLGCLHIALRSNGVARKREASRMLDVCVPAADVKDRCFL